MNYSKLLRTTEIANDDGRRIRRELESWVVFPTLLLISYISLEMWLNSSEPHVFIHKMEEVKCMLSKDFASSNILSL